MGGGVRRALGLLLAALALVLGGVSLVSIPAAAEVGARYVSTTGEDAANDCASAESPCATVAHALEEASPGDVVEIEDGVYTEALTVDQDVTLRRRGGAGADDAVILQSCSIPQLDEECPDAPGWRVITVDGASLVLEDVTVRHGAAEHFAELGSGVGGGVFVVDGDLALARARVTANGGGSPGSGCGAGIASVRSDLTIVDSEISDNRAHGCRGGGIFSSGGLITVTDSTISHNTASLGGGGVYLAQGTTLTLIGSTVSENRAGRGGGISGYQATITIREQSSTPATSRREPVAASRP